MNTLLPKSEVEFSELTYWERFFKSRSKSFDWYGEYFTLVELFSKYVKSQDDILVVGCGNSTLSYDLHVTQKCSKVVSIDISNTAIDQMLSKHAKLICKVTDKKQKAFDFKCLDVCKFSQDPELKKILPLSCVIDKGTTDAIHSGGSSSENVIKSMWCEIEKNLSVMGRYVLITLAQSHIVDSIADIFLRSDKKNQWMINVHEIANTNSDDKNFYLPVFAFIFYKMKPSSSLPLVYVEENSFSKATFHLKTDKKLLTNPIEELKQWISSRQQLSIVSHSMQEQSNETESVINMVSSKSGLVRYHCIVVRNNYSNAKKKSQQMAYCVFIVPFGFNDSKLVNDKHARLKLCLDHLKSRVCMFVYLNPREYYTSRQMIQDELNSVAVKFCPSDVSNNYSIPFVSCHDLVYSCNISTHNKYLVECLDTTDGPMSRLIATDDRKLSVIIADKPLTIRDQLLSNYIRLLPSLRCGQMGMYYGHINCTNTLDKNWKIVIPRLDNQISSVIENKWQLNCSDTIDSCDKFDYIVYDCNVPDRVAIDKTLQQLSNSGIAILCCDDASTLSDIISDLSPLSLQFSCETVDLFGGDKTTFSILSQIPIDVDILRHTYESH